jgi:hypothetical protein
MGLAGIGSDLVAWAWWGVRLDLLWGVERGSGLFVLGRFPFFCFRFSSLLLKRAFEMNLLLLQSIWTLVIGDIELPTSHRRE